MGWASRSDALYKCTNWEANDRVGYLAHSQLGYPLSTRFLSFYSLIIQWSPSPQSTRLPKSCQTIENLRTTDYAISLAVFFYGTKKKRKKSKSICYSYAPNGLSYRNAWPCILRFQFGRYSVLSELHVLRCV